MSFVTSSIVRDPVSRFLSAYLDKIRDFREYRRIEGLEEHVNNTGHDPPSFSEFADYLMETSNPNQTDEHFMSQSAWCGHRNFEYDFFTYLRFMYEDFKEFAESLGFWEEYAATGWTRGDSKVSAFGEKAVDRPSHDSGGLLREFYTEPLLMKVYNYYKEDFDRFGFSIEDMLATNSERQNTADTKLLALLRW